jgi:nucleoside phosphorylase/CheY-like chemotaxis protein
MKILIVEDNSEKLRIVAAMLSQLEGVSIRTAHDAAQAKREMQTTQYDVLILDVAIPKVAGAHPSPESGKALLDDIIRRDKFLKPREIIGLTGYSDIASEVGPIFQNDLLTLVYFDPASDGWSTQIKRKLKYLELASRAKAIPEYQTDLCVLTALQSPEFTALLRVPWDWEKYEVDRDATTYWKGSYVCRDKQKRTVTAACASRMGIAAAASLASKMIHQFTPRYIAMTGIAAGIEDSCSLGDVLAVDPSWDWGSGKYMVKKKQTLFESAPHQLPLTAFIRSKLQLMSQDSQFFERVRSEWPEERKAVLRMHLGPVASGAAVLADKSKVDEIREQHRKVLGIEMEAYGVFSAADEAPLPLPQPFVMKSVVDFADSKKGNAEQAYAAYTSARSLAHFVENYL